MSGLLDEFAVRSGRLTDDMEKYANDEIGMGSMGLRLAGETAGAVGDTMGAGLQMVPGVEEAMEAAGPLIVKGMQQLWNGVKDTGAVKAAQKWAEDNPEGARNVMMGLQSLEFLPGAAAVKAGRKMTKYGPDAQKGGMLSNANNTVDNYYGMTHPDKIGGVTKAMEGPVKAVSERIAPHADKLPPQVRGMVKNAVDEPLAASAAGMGLLRTGANTVKDAVRHQMSPTSRAMYGEGAITVPVQDRMKSLLDKFDATGKPDSQMATTNMSREAHAQSLFSNLHIPDQMGRKGPRLPEVDAMETKQFASDPMAYSPGAISKGLRDFTIKRDDWRPYRGKKLATKAKGWEDATKVKISQKDADYVEKLLTGETGLYKGQIDELRFKAPAGIETGGHYGDVLVNRNQAMPYITDAFKKTRNDSGVTDVGKMFDELQKGSDKARKKAGGKKGKHGFKVLNKSKEDAAKNGLWLQGSAVGSGITEGGIGWLMKVKPNGELMAFMMDKHDWMGPLGDAVIKKDLVAITPPMMGHIDQLRKTGFVPASNYKQVPTRQTNYKSKELIEGLANAKPSKQSVRGEQLKQAGYGWLGANALYDQENR